MRGRGGLVPRSGALVGEPDPEDPHFVHDEVKEVAAKVKGVIEERFQRHGTNEKQILMGIRQFGVSEQSKTMMAREKAAAEMAVGQGIYGVYRNENARHEVNRDYCSRVGPMHKCFCGHTLSDHAPIIAKRGFLASPRCQLGGCSCDEYRYVPNEPEEVGDHWLSRRKGFVPGQWVPKCRCGHGSNAHDASKKGGGCRECTRCYRFESHFACVVCDRPWEEHVTLFESEQERLSAGRPVRGDFIPLNDLGADIKDIVFGGALGSDQITGGGHRIGVVDDGEIQLRGGRGRAITGGRGAASTNVIATAAGGRGTTRVPIPVNNANPRDDLDAPGPASAIGAMPADRCPNCATLYRSATSKFCVSCGCKRPNM